ncbi:Putative bacterial sensory transduction regulator [Corynebacterium mustelae]|uniref:Putative bacterial sensory transduction regulator n=1 Tax=Corynebacterium mustelae TaxID=571915 RepID=A0A0G3H0W6_9CORY|nr:YbjN domain-containing protein [Corynebacterium mustelae]AKK07056.1 Putative bacterial sensory transduction regulator [Corynebacterium mustelae]
MSTEFPLVTPERLTHILAGYGVVPEIDGDYLAAELDGLFLLMQIQAPQVMRMAVIRENVPIAAERFPELEAWSGFSNRMSMFGKTVVGSDADSGVFVRRDCAFPIRNGASDEQLQEWIDAGFESAFELFDALRFDLNLP